jgi:hypothetical protein
MEDTPRMRMYVWDGRGAYKVVVCATHLEEARRLAILEIEHFGLIGASHDSPIARAKDHVSNTMPDLYFRPNAEFVLTVNGETEELNFLLEAKDEQLKALQKEKP